MGYILLGACILVCPLVMGLMMLNMRRGTPLRKRRSRDEDVHEASRLDVNE